MIEVLTADDPAWDERIVGAPRDVYHTAGFHQNAARSGEGRPFMVVVTEEGRGLIWPYILRPISQVAGLEDVDGMDVGSVYGYPGPVVWGCSPGSPFLGRAWQAIRDLWHEQGVVSAFTRFNPLLGNATLADDLLLPQAPGSGPLVQGGATVSMDCSIDDEQAEAQYARVLRQEIAAGRKAGLETNWDEDWRELESFVDLYRETMERSGAAEHYFLRSEDVHRLRSALDGRIHLLVTRLGDAIGAIGMFTEYNGIVQAHLVGTSHELRSHSPLKVLLDDARRWAGKRGNTVLHLGGGRGGQSDSLFAFKARFSSRRHWFYTGQWILDESRYRDLVHAHWGDQGPPPETRYFPTYRASPADENPGP